MDEYSNLSKNIIKVYRKDGIFDCLILRHKLTGEYSFINLTKGHICPCRFKTVDEALEDLKKYIKNGRVIKYEIIRNK